MGISRRNCIVWRMVSEKNPQVEWCCTNAICVTDWKAVPRLQGCRASQLSTCYFLKSKGCVLSWYVWFFSCLRQNSGFFLVDFFRKHLEGLLTSSWGEWPATRYVNVFVPWAFWLLLEYEVHVCLIEHFPFLLFELNDSFRLLSVSSLSCW